MEVVSIFLNKVLSEAAKRNASVLYLSVGSKPAVKVDGQMVSMENESVITSDTLGSILDSILSTEEFEKLKHDREITVVKVFGGSFRFRVNVFYQKNLLSISFYYIQPVIRQLSEYGFSPAINNIVANNHGLLIISGAFGSGRTSMAVSFIEEINKNYGRNIVMLEEQTEFVMISKKSLISQRQIGADALSFSEALDYCLEEDIDVLYISRIKDEFKECLPKILQLAAGNCLVIWEMDCDSSTKAVQTILSSVGETSFEALRYNLSDALIAVIVQKLVTKIGGGLVSANEILVVNSPIKSMIREGKIFQIDSIIQTSRQEGMISMVKFLDELVKAGVVRAEDAQ